MKKCPPFFTELFFVAIIISLVLPLYGQTPAPPKTGDKPKAITKSSAKEAETPKKDTKSPAPIQVFPVPEQSKQESPNKGDKHNDKVTPDVWIARFTGALVGVGILQFIALILQVYWMSKHSREIKESIAITKETTEAVKLQTQTMRDEITLKCRSKIHVRDVVIPYFEDPLGKGEFLEGQLSIVNLGGMPANVINMGAWFEIGYEKGLPTEMPDESEKPNIPNPQPTKLEVGQSVRYKFADERRPWSYYEPIRMKPSENTLYVVGYVKYTDVTGLPRYSRIFREYRLPKDQTGLHKISRRFFPVEGYEYEE